VRRKKSAKNNVNRFDYLICYSFFVGEERGIEKENKNKRKIHFQENGLVNNERE